MLTSPFVVGRSVAYQVNCDGFNGTAIIQSSPDNTTWTDVVTITETGSDRSLTGSIALKDYMRARVTARTAGEIDIHLVAASS